MNDNQPKNPEKPQDPTSETEKNLEQVLIGYLAKNENKIFPSKSNWILVFALYLGYAILVVLIIYSIYKDYIVIIKDIKPDMYLEMFFFFLILASSLIAPFICLLIFNKSKDKVTTDDLPYKLLQHLINTVSDLDKKTLIRDIDDRLKKLEGQNNSNNENRKHSVTYHITF